MDSSTNRPSYPRVSIIVLNWNGLEDTIECLESLKRMSYPSYDVIVVDNASSGDDVEALRGKYGDYVHVIANDRNCGFSEGNNVGIRYALSKGSDYVFLLNNDTVVDGASLSELIRVAEEDARAGIFGGKIFYYASPDRLQSVGGKTNWWLGRFKDYGGQQDAGQFDRVAERDFVYATAMLIKRAVLEKTGFLDSSLFFGMEDYDYCARAAKAGFRVVYVPGAKVWHKQGASRRRLPDYPETWRLVSREIGILAYKPKPVLRIFRRHGPRYLFLFPAVSFLVYQSLVNVVGMMRGSLYHMYRGNLAPFRRYGAGMLRYLALRMRKSVQR